jgi:predicted glycosyltransferase involved in capsule biosynthesis
MKIATVTPIKIFVDEQGQWSRSPERIEIQLRSLKAQKGDFNIHSIITDMSTDPEVITALKSIASKHGATYLNTASTLIWNKALCLNVGICAVSTDCDYIATLDADLIYREDTFQGMLALAKAGGQGNSVVVCRTFMYNKSTYSDSFSQAEFQKIARDGKWLNLAGNGGIQFFEREWLQSVRGYDERYNLWGGPDNEIINRAKRAGKNIRWLSKGKDQIYLIHLDHPRWVIPGMTFDEIQRYRKTVNHGIYHQTPAVVANLDGWGSEELVSGPRSKEEIKSKQR